MAVPEETEPSATLLIGATAIDFRASYTLPISRDWLAETLLYLQVSDPTNTGSNKATNRESRGRGDRLLDDIEHDGRTVQFGMQGNF